LRQAFGCEAASGDEDGAGFLRLSCQGLGKCAAHSTSSGKIRYFDGGSRRASAIRERPGARQAQKRSVTLGGLKPPDHQARRGDRGRPLLFTGLAETELTCSRRSEAKGPWPPQTSSRLFPGEPERNRRAKRGGIRRTSIGRRRSAHHRRGGGGWGGGERRLLHSWPKVIEPEARAPVAAVHLQRLGDGFVRTSPRPSVSGKKAGTSGGRPSRSAVIGAGRGLHRAQFRLRGRQ